MGRDAGHIATTTSDEIEESMSTEAITKRQPTMIAESVERVLIGGDLSALNPEQRLNYYKAVCDSVGLNPLTKPFDYLNLNGKLVLYAKRDATDQLRKIHAVSITSIDSKNLNDVFIVTAHAKDGSGREDSSTGAVNIGNLKGDALANALMKAETKAKRRVTLSICGLGLLDETEVETIPDARPFQEPKPPQQPPRTAPRQAEKVMCASCGSSNGHEPSCKYHPQNKSEQTVLPPENGNTVTVYVKDVQAKKTRGTEKAPPRQYVIITCVDLKTEKEFDVFAFHNTTSALALSFQGGFKGKEVELVIESKTANGKTMLHLLEVKRVLNVKFENNQPITTNGITNEDVQSVDGPSAGDLGFE